MKKLIKTLREEKGFTLLEILLVVAAIAILAGIVILALNPSKQLAETRNAQRWSDVNTILNAAYQYSIDNNGDVPSTITTTATGVCKTTPSNDCTNLIDLGVLTNNETYLVGMPVDPNPNATACTDTDDSTCYEILQTSNGRITVSAPSAEEGETISVTR